MLLRIHEAGIRALERDVAGQVWDRPLDGGVCEVDEFGHVVNTQHLDIRAAAGPSQEGKCGGAEARAAADVKDACGWLLQATLGDRQGQKVEARGTHVHPVAEDRRPQLVAVQL